MSTPSSPATEPDERIEREAILRAAVAAMPHTNPGVADDLIDGFHMHTEAEDIIAIWQAARAFAAPTAPAPTEPDCSGGMPCTTCQDKRKCQRGCIRQIEAVEKPDRKYLRAECDSVDALLRGLGLDPERCRTEGGTLNVGRTLSLLKDGCTTTEPAQAGPASDAVQIADAIDPFTRKQAPDHLTMGVAARLLRALATPPSAAAQPEAVGEPTDADWAHFGAWAERDKGAMDMLEKLIDVWDDGQLPHEHRCYVDGAWAELIAEARALCAAAPTTEATSSPSDAELTDAQIDAGIKAWFSTPVFAGRQPFEQRLRAAIRATKGGEL